MSFWTWLIHGPAYARAVNRERVLLALAAAGEPLSGYPLARAARVGSGAVYVALDGLERDGLVASEWEILPESVDRPRRRYYQLTAAGEIQARRGADQPDSDEED